MIRRKSSGPPTASCVSSAASAWASVRLCPGGATGRWRDERTGRLDRAGDVADSGGGRGGRLAVAAVGPGAPAGVGRGPRAGPAAVGGWRVDAALRSGPLPVVVVGMGRRDGGLRRGRRPPAGAR